MTDIEAVKMARDIAAQRVIDIDDVDSNMDTDRPADDHVIPYAFNWITDEGRPTTGHVELDDIATMFAAGLLYVAHERAALAAKLLAAHALIEKQRAVVDASKAWHSAKCNRFPGCGDPNDGRFDGTHDWQCPVDTTESGLHDAVIALDTLASVGGEEGSK